MQPPRFNACLRQGGAALSFSLLGVLALGLGACSHARYAFRPEPGYLHATEQPAQPASNEVIVAPATPAATAALAAAGPQAIRPGARRRRVLRRIVPSTTRTAAQPTRRATARVLRAALAQESGPYRSRGIALLLAFLLGSFGAHLFYLGYYGRGVAYLAGYLVGAVLLSVGALVLFVSALGGGGGGALGALVIGAILLSVLGVLALVDAVRIATGDLKPKNGAYYPRFFQTSQKR